MVFLGCTFAVLQETEHPVFNLSIEVSLKVKFIVQVGLPLRYGIFFNSVVPTYMISLPTPVANTLIVKSLFAHERARKITSVTNSIRRKCLKCALRCLESSLAHWVK